MANTIVNLVKYPAKVQAFLRSELVADRICTTMFKDITPFQQIVFPYMNDARVQTYTYSGSNTVDDTTMTTDGYTIDQVKTATANYDPVQNALFQDPAWQGQMAQNMAYQLARNIDQYVLATGVAGAYSTTAGGTISASTLLALLAGVDASLTEQEAFAGMRYVVLDPQRCALLPQMDASQGYMAADKALAEGINGYVGKTSVGLYVFRSNNLPYSVTLTMDTQPTAGDTFTLRGVTWEYIADGGVATAGQLKIGTDLADAKLITVAAINGTTAPSVGDYVDVSTDQRRILQNSQTSAAAFATNDCVITGYGRTAASQTFTAVTNVFGTETGSTIAGVAGAIDLTVLREPMVEELSVSSVGAANHSKNLIATTLYGAGVYTRRKRGLVKITFNA